MKKRTWLYVLIAAVMALGIGAFAACHKKPAEPMFEVSESSMRIWLDRYAECDVTLVKGDADALRWTSKDSAVVTVEKGRLIAQGVGETTVEVSDGKTTVRIAVKVNDPGVLPVIGFGEFDAYLDVETEIPHTVSYNGAEYTGAFDYTVEIGDETVAVMVGNKIKGLKIGTTDVTLTAPYKGLTLTKTVTLNVKESVYVSFGREEETIYNVSGKLGTVALGAVAYRLGEPVEDAQIVYTAIEGAEFVTFEGEELTSALVGQQLTENKSVKIKAEYTDGGKTYSAVLNVTLHPDFAETYFENVSLDNITWEETDEEIGGRRGNIMKYSAGSDYDPDRPFEFRVAEKNRGSKLTDLYRDGYRYFAYDLYYGSTSNLMVGCGPYVDWIAVGDYFRFDYMKIIKGGKVTNVLEKDTWITVAYDFRVLWLLDQGRTSDFFFFVLDGETTSYLMNARYYMSDSFLPSENLEYEDKGTYVQASNEEFRIGVPVSKSYSEGVPSITVNPGEAPEYAAAESASAAGGREGAYIYKTRVSGATKNVLAVATSMNRSYDDSMYALTQKGHFFTFDLYVDTAESVTFSLNGGKLSATVAVGAGGLGEYEDWLVIFKGGKRQNKLERGAWVTVSLAFYDAFDDTAYSAQILFSANEENDILYIDNIRFEKDGSFLPDEYEEEDICPTSYDGIATVGKITQGDHRGAYSYSNPSNGKMNFKGVTDADNHASEFFGGGYRFVRFEIFVYEKVTSVRLVASGERNFTNYDKTIMVGEPITGGDVYLFREDGTAAETLERNDWYIVYLPVTYSGMDLGDVEVYVLTGGGTDSAPAVADVRYLRFEYALRTLFNEGRYADQVTISYMKDGQYSGSFKYENKTSGEAEGENQNWGESGVYFSDVTGADNSTALAFFKDGFHWIKTDILIGENVESISIRVTGDRNFTNYWVHSVKIGEKFTGGATMYLVSEDVRVDKLERDTWYTLYIPVEYTMTDVGGIYVMVYTNGGSPSAPAVMYFRNIEYLEEAEIPEYAEEPEKASLYLRDDYKDDVTLTRDEDGVYTYENRTSGIDEGNKSNWGESGVFFSEVSAGEKPFFAAGYRYIKLDLYVKENVTSIMLRFGAQTNSSFWIDKIEIGKELPFGRGIYLFNEDGTAENKLLEKTWYTLYLPVTDREVHNCIMSSGGGVDKPATMLLKNIDYLTKMTVQSTIPTGENENLTVNVEGNYVAGEGAKVYFRGQHEAKANNVYESVSYFFRDGYHYISAKVKFTSAEEISLTVIGNLTDGESYQTPEYTCTLAEIEADSKFTFLDGDGRKVNSVTEGEWYTMIVEVPYTEGPYAGQDGGYGWGEAYLKVTGSGSQMEFKEVNMLQTYDMPSE